MDRTMAQHVTAGCRCFDERSVDSGSDTYGRPHVRHMVRWSGGVARRVQHASGAQTTEARHEKERLKTMGPVLHSLE